MIKNIIILVLILALGGMMWVAIPEEQRGKIAGIEHLSQQAREVTAKVEAFWPSKVHQEEPNKATPALPVTSPELDEPNPTAPAGRTASTEAAETVSNDSSMLASVPSKEGKVRGSEQTIEEPQVRPYPESKALKTEGRISENRDSLSKKELSQGELSEILSLLKRAKDKLRKTFFSVQPKPPAHPSTPDSKDRSPVQKKFDDGPREQG